MLMDFNLELAKSGKPVCTRDGRSVRIICFDVMHEDYPIAALVKHADGEQIQSYTVDGHYYCNGDTTDDDLVMADCNDKYHIALERAKNLIKNGDLSEEATKCLSEVFDEIDTNGYDIMVINALISVLKSDFEEEATINGITVGNIISWLYSKKRLDAIKQ